MAHTGMTGQTGLYPTLAPTEPSVLPLAAVDVNMVVDTATVVIFPNILFNPGEDYKRPLILGFTLRPPISVVTILCGYQLSQITSTSWFVSAAYRTIGAADGTPPGEKNYPQSFECRYIAADFNR